MMLRIFVIYIFLPENICYILNELKMQYKNYNYFRSNKYSQHIEYNSHNFYILE